MTKIDILAIVQLHILLCTFTILTKEPLYIATCADEGHFDYLLNFIGAIHKVNFDDLGEIAIFDLGFTPEQKNQLGKIAKVSVYLLEMTHPDLLTHFIVRPNGRTARGWYAWKPVALKQALDMFSNVLYSDCRIIFLKPLNNLFKHIHQYGYYFITCGHSIAWMTTEYVRNLFNLSSPEYAWILAPQTYGISAGLQGLSRNLYNSYVLPMYELSKQFRPFIDDGTTPNGFGTGRHDQTLFSIYVRLLHLDIFSNRGGTLVAHNIISPIKPGVDFLWKTASHPDLKKYIKYRK